MPRHFALPRAAGLMFPLHFKKLYIHALTLFFLRYCLNDRGGGARGVGVGGGVQLLVPVGGWCCDDNDGGYSPTAADFCYVGQGGVLIT